MSATPRGVKGPPKLIRILMLPLLIILLLLLVAYAALPYLPLRAPTQQAATTPLPPLTEAPSATPAPLTPTEPPPTPTPAATATETPPPTDTPAATATEPPTISARPTNTPVVVSTPTATRTTPPLAAASPTRARPSPTPVGAESPGDMEALAETAEPLTPPPSATAPPPTRPPVASVVRPTLAPPPTAVPRAGVGELLTNGDFTRGYQDNGVAVGWNGFSNSHAEFHYRADDWPRVIVAPDTGQTMRIRNADLPDRYLGIYQTVNVVPGQVYTFSIAGLVRTNAGDVQHTRFGYRMEVGFDTLGSRNWKRVPEWLELPWDEQARAQDSYRIEVFTTTVEAETERLTVFVRAWKKWADAGEGAYDVLRASLIGPLPPVAPQADGAVQALGMPVTGLGETTLWEHIRVVVTLLLLVVLVGGAVWRLRPWRAR